MQQTQPTQILPPVDGASTPLSRSGNSVVQVARSSPVSDGVVASSSPPLVNLMAPAGTQFRPPQVAKRAPVIDGGPTYRGGASSDEEDSRVIPGSDIKTSTFTKSPQRVAESPVGSGGGGTASARDIFREVTSAAVYRPTATVGGKRSAVAPVGVAVKKARQDAPARAQPIAKKITSLHDIEDHKTRLQVLRIQKIMPGKTVQAYADALQKCRNNHDRALEYLANAEDQERAAADKSSDDELVTTRPVPPESNGATGAAKQQIKSRGTIQDKWSLFQMPVVQRRSPQEVGGSQEVGGGDDSEKSRKSKKGSSTNSRSRKRSESPEEVFSVSSGDDGDGAADNEPEVERRETKVLRFFNECDAASLADIAGISEDTAKLIISKRPFKSLFAVRFVAEPVPEDKAKGDKARKAQKPIGDRIVDKCLDMWAGYEAVDSLVAKCEALGRPIAAEMERWGVNIFGNRDGQLDMVSLDGKNYKSDEDGDVKMANSSSPHSKKTSKFISQPSIMAEGLQMKDFQIVGINWLNLLFTHRLSCILADEMGLGKTLQVIAFLAHLYEKGIKGPHLIVVPASTIENWLREFQKFCPTLSVVPYYSQQKTRMNLQETILNNLDNINVVVTTYTTAKGKYDAPFLRKMNFCVCVYDEGHMLKSNTSTLYEKLIRIRARFRLLLTGTPLQNNLQELASLLGFILPSVFQERKDDLQYIFSNKAKTTDESQSSLLSAQRIERAKSMLKPFVLRRKKHQVIDLPAKKSRVVYCDMNETQRDIYSSKKEEVRQLLEDRAAGRKTGNRSGNVLMKLRQAAIHPLLFRRIYDDAMLKRMAKACLKEEIWSQSDPDVIYEELQGYNDFECHTMCIEHPKSLGEFALQTPEWMNSGKVTELCSLLSQFKEAGDRTLIFSQFTMVMDILELVLETEHTGFVRLDGRTNVDDRQSILDAFYERTDIPVFLLSTKAGGTGINLACANKVIIFDSSFNPQEDVQAENRAHRVGQTREVEVIRLVTRDTIEEQIYRLGQTKLALGEAVAGNEEKKEETGMKIVEDMVLADVKNETDVKKEKVDDKTS